LKGKHHDRCSDNQVEIETQLAPQGGWPFVLELNAERTHSMNIDDSNRKMIVTDGRFPMASWSTSTPPISTGPTWASATTR